jgi:hypothetical protein
MDALQKWFREQALRKAIDVALDYLADPANHAAAKTFLVAAARAASKKTDNTYDDRAADVVAKFLGVK